MAIEIVDFPSYNMVMFHGKMLVHQRVYLGTLKKICVGEISHDLLWSLA